MDNVANEVIREVLVGGICGPYPNKSVTAFGKKSGHTKTRA